MKKSLIMTAIGAIMVLLGIVLSGVKCDTYNILAPSIGLIVFGAIICVVFGILALFFKSGCFEE